MRCSWIRRLFQTTTSLVLLACACHASWGVNVHEANGVVSMENAHTRVDFYLQKGTFSACNKSDRAGNITDAYVKVNDYSSNVPGVKTEWIKESVKDAIGSGSRLRFTISVAGRPDLLLQITLYDDAGFLALVAGIDNITGTALRIKEMSPLTGARAFSASGAKTEVSVLSGAAHGAVTKGSDTFGLFSPGSILLTFVSDEPPMVPTAKGNKHEAVAINKENRRSLVVGGLTYHDFLKCVSLQRSSGADSFDVQALCVDPVGELVEAGHLYMPDDCFYVDFSIPNPFNALEQYGEAVRAAQGALPTVSSYPIVDGLQASLPVHGGVAGINTSSGLVGELQDVARTGFTKYAKVGVRLSPDEATRSDSLGWWDDQYWQKCGHFTAPYETPSKWAKALRDLNGIPIILLRTPQNLPSEDMRKAMLSSKENLANARIRGVDLQDAELGRTPLLPAVVPSAGKVDSSPGPLHTSAHTYREFYEMGRAAVCADCLLDERNPAIPGAYVDEQVTCLPVNTKTELPQSDLTVGLVDSQSISGDGSSSADDLYTDCGLKWYKSRMLYTYDVGPIDLTLVKPANADGRRRILTLAYITAGKLSLARSFAKMTSEEVWDLSRIFPIHGDTRSFRPLDAFSSEGRPRVYDLDVSAHWRQVVFYNFDPENQETIGVDLSKDSGSGGLGLDPKKSYYVYDFWNDKCIGKLPGSGRLEQTLRPGEARVMSVHEVEAQPQPLSTNRHVMCGYVDLYGTQWSPSKKELSGISNVVGGETYKVVLATNGYKPQTCVASGGTCKLESFDAQNGLAVISIERKENGAVNWTVGFSLVGNGR